MPVCNTHVAGMQSTATKNVCTATASLLAGFGDNGSYSLRPIPIWFSRRAKSDVSREKKISISVSF